MSVWFWLVFTGSCLYAAYLVGQELVETVRSIWMDRRERRFHEALGRMEEW